jgi:uncharacterized protein YceK
MREVFARQFYQQSWGTDMRRFFIIGLLAFALTGCGTAKNFTEGWLGQMEPYGGVKNAVNEIKNGYDVELAYTMPLRLADVGLSAVGDTLTLPVTLPIAAVRAIRDHYFPKKAPESQPPTLERPAPDDAHLTPERIHGGII